MNALLVETRTPIVYFNLGNNEITPKAVGYICEALKQTNGLVHLDLSNVDAMQKNKVGWQGGKMIADYLHRALVTPCLLQILNLSGTTLGSKGAECVLLSMSQAIHSLHIMDLDISRNEITFGAEHLGPLAQILSSPKSSLERLNLSSNIIGDEVMGQLAASMGHRTALLMLKVDNCRLTFKGLCSALRHL